MNKIMVYGHLGSDVTLSTPGNSTNTCANFTVAAQNKQKQQDGTYGTNWYRVSCWGKTAELAAKFLKKGHRVTVTGDLIIRNYKTQDGRDGTSVDINNAEFDLVEKRSETEGMAPAASAPATQQFTPVENDDLPF